MFDVGVENTVDSPVGVGVGVEVGVWARVGVEVWVGVMLKLGWSYVEVGLELGWG